MIFNNNIPVSNCCGAPAVSNGDNDLSDFNICSDCGEHCEYIDDEQDEDLGGTGHGDESFSDADPGL